MTTLRDRIHAYMPAGASEGLRPLSHESVSQPGKRTLILTLRRKSPLDTAMKHVAVAAAATLAVTEGIARTMEQSGHKKIGARGRLAILSTLAIPFVGTGCESNSNGQPTSVESPTPTPIDYSISSLTEITAANPFPMDESIRLHQDPQSQVVLKIPPLESDSSLSSEQFTYSLDGQHYTTQTGALFRITETLQITPTPPSTATTEKIDIPFFVTNLKVTQQLLDLINNPDFKFSTVLPRLIFQGVEMNGYTPNDPSKPPLDSPPPAGTGMLQLIQVNN